MPRKMRRFNWKLIVMRSYSAQSANRFTPFSNDTRARFCQFGLEWFQWWMRVWLATNLRRDLGHCALLTMSLNSAMEILFHISATIYKQLPPALWMNVPSDILNELTSVQHLR